MGQAGALEPSHSLMPTLLFLSQSLPFPPDTGGTQRTFQVLNQLQREFDVHLIPFSRREHQPTRAKREAAQRALSGLLTKVYEPVPYGCEWSRTRRLLDHARSVLSQKAYSHFQYYSPTFEEHLAHALRSHPPDLVHFDTVDLSVYFDSCSGVPRTCTHHDIESHLLERRADNARPSFVGAYIRHQARLIADLERRYCPMYDLNLTMSERDSRRLLDVAPGSKVQEAPNAVDLDNFQLPEAEPAADSVIFMGPTYLFANRDAVSFLLSDIWPHVRELRPTAELTLIGKNAPGQRAEYGRTPGVRPLGRVESVQPHLGAAACSVIPIRVGGGTRIKILESWALGCAVVTTSLGCEGLEVMDGENALVRDEPESFAQAVSDVLSNPALRRALGASGRATVERHYNWDRVGASIRESYRKLIP